MTDNETEPIILDNVRYIPRFHTFRQVDGETPEEVARRYPGRQLYMLAGDYTQRVWVDMGEAREENIVSRMG